MQNCRKFRLSTKILCITNLEQLISSTQYDLLRIAEGKYSSAQARPTRNSRNLTLCTTKVIMLSRNSRNVLLGMTYSEQQKYSARYQQKYFTMLKQKLPTSNSQKQLTQKNLTQKQSTQKWSTWNSRNDLLCITYSEQQKYSTPYKGQRPH